jgi:hypothetical protein
MKKKKIVDTIISSISDCWMIQRKKGKIFIANCVQSSGGITRIFVCPMRHEIVGGSKDGRIGYFSFSFGIVKFIKICKSHDIIVKDLVLLSRGKKKTKKRVDVSLQAAAAWTLYKSAMQLASAPRSCAWP